MTRRRFAIVIVNYNCAPLAIDAALSALGSARPGEARAIIIDNASTDGSLAQLRQFAARRSRRPGDAAPGVAFADPGALAVSTADAGREVNDADDISIIFTQTNRGFAAGCNLGLRALDPKAHDVIVLLNPDATLAKGALEGFAARLADPAVGLCGASVMSAASPHLAHAFGGARLEPLTLAGVNLGAGLSYDDAPATDDIERALDYPLGAAIGLKPDYVDRAGFLDERYFLYYEEADWALAGAMRVGWARDALVYHRYGGSTKSRATRQGAPSERSPLSDYHMARSRLLFALKWRPWLAPLLMGAGCAQALRRALRGRSREARAVALGSLPGAAREFHAR